MPEPPNKNAGDSKKRFEFTDRDMEILRALERYRYLRTGQIQRLIFPGNKTIQSTRRRLRYLLQDKCVGRIEPYVQVGKGSAESAYYLDKKGAQILRQAFKDFKPTLYKKASRVKYQFLQHALDISEFRVHLESGLADHTSVELHRFVADFEIKTHAHNAIGHKRYKLYDEVAHPLNKRNYIVYPDALIILRGTGKYEDYRKIYLLEIDRGTEGLRILQNKLIGYNLYLREGVFKKFGKFTDFRVLFQARSEKRAQNIRDAFLGMDGNHLVWVTESGLVNDKSIIGESIWIDHEGAEQSILK